MSKYFNVTDTIYHITNHFPETIDLFAANGFENLKNQAMRETLGKSIRLGTALTMKKINQELFIEKLNDLIEQNKSNESKAHTQAASGSKEAIRVEGVLPCPVRLPLMEKFESFLESKKDTFDFETEYHLKSANLGLDDIKERILSANGNPDLISDLYLSAGFDLFFDQELIGQYQDLGVFEDLSGLEKLNSDLDNEAISLKDPKKQYAIIGIVPAVFMVNSNALGDRPFPESWEDLMKPEFENSINLPMKDLDLFNAFLLHIHRFYGEEGVHKMGKALLQSMHPAQMVKSHAAKNGNPVPAITVAPYFFASMADEKSPMRAVWPKDGAIISPIFLLAKSKNKEKVKPFVDFLYSKEIGDVLSSNGKFPSTNPVVDNRLSPDQKFMWLGWDYIHSNDIGELIKTIEEQFFNAAKKELS
ncbi:ABC transporter substrate-binding protein [Clostridium sp. E02]|uniref:ABC transporter substrate-binding protein n=1 Tax=Clostridium sp. E02 TaxID=2487134 RepID=UPI000F5482BC|nr:ABC transporter substrate-binding protein [Clostridium sp. E02]